MSEQAAEYIRTIIGSWAPDNLWIRTAIDKAYIPHPFEVWDEPIDQL